MIKKFTKTAVQSFLFLFVFLQFYLTLFAYDLKELSKGFEYDKTISPSVEIKDKTEFYNSTKYHLFYTSASGERIPAYFIIPKKIPTGGVPAIFFMHFHVSDKSLSDVFSTQWAGYGLATFAIDGVFKGERSVDGKDLMAEDPKITFQNMKTQILDILTGIDVMAKWEGINSEKLGYFGISAGALTGAAPCAIDKRIKAAVLLDGGGDFEKIFMLADYRSLNKMREFLLKNKIQPNEIRELFKTIDPINYVEYISPAPVLMINGKKDTVIPVPTIEALYAKLKEPKKIIWYDAGHEDLPLDKALSEVRKWFVKYLK